MPTEKHYKNPEIFNTWFDEYVSITKANPRIKYNLCQKTAEMIPEELEPPLTIEGYLVFCYDKGCCSIHDYWYNKDERYSEYATIFTRIREKIRIDQITGGMVGQFNGNLTARLNGLVDKSEQKQEHTVKSVTGIEIIRISKDASQT
jgi:hypothetical protein